MTQPAGPPAAAQLAVVPDLLERRAGEDPDGIAFIVDGHATLSFREWETRSRAVAHSLLDMGAGRGRRIGLLFAGLDWIEYAVAYLGVLRTGATAVHINDALPPAEVRRRFDECGVARLVHADRLVPPAGFDGTTHPLSTLDTGTDLPLSVAIDPADISDVLYTSGTTGPAKAYTVPHGNLTFGKQAAATRDFRVAGHMLVPMTLGTSTSATCVNSALSAPAVSVVCDPDDIDRMGQLIEQFAIQSLAITPWIAIQLLAADIAGRYDVSSVTMVASGSSPLPPPIARAVLAAFPGARIMSACSQSEAGPALVVNMFDPAKPLSVGRPTPTTELRLVGADGAEVPQGEVGEIWLRHQAPRRLYLNAELHRGDEGWYRTGDYGRLGDDGSLYFFDRGVDMLRTADGPVSTIEVEAALYEHPAVREAAVFGGPDGEVLAAVALSDPDALAEVEAATAGRLAPHQVPVHILALPTLPRSQNGKVLKRELREQAALTAAR
ncbi:acyl--CoA ligase [Dactylosporangium vinaceum]|uniref:Class I adenylate-forming enzyme family protein n=1 Tax=Dactylosporangium vinaceum TaxID=53362 RepID=A0ABV5MKN4_9ACTN|nr:class I adenylate-forming enzyme family protein [Dactylosporangium vinaceum]UAB93893.1 acyl--CoA ligase [Dactylosporangium vinaceum]